MITNPHTKQLVSLQTKQGRDLLRNYVTFIQTQQQGGSSNESSNESSRVPLLDDSNTTIGGPPSSSSTIVVPSSSDTSGIINTSEYDRIEQGILKKNQAGPFLFEHSVDAKHEQYQPPPSSYYSKKTDTFAQIRDEVNEYMEKRTGSNSAKLLDELLANVRCLEDDEEYNKLTPAQQKKYKRKFCFFGVVKQMAFSRYIRDVAHPRTMFIVIPSRNDKVAFTKQNKMITDYPDYGYTVTYDTRSQFLAVVFPDIVMFDYDYKDGEDPLVIQERLQKVSDISAKYGDAWTFLLFKSDKGVHVFLASHRGNFKDLRFAEMMSILCNDPWYVSFVYSVGWAIRINPKQGRPDDFIADPGINVPLPFVKKNNKAVTKDDFYLNTGSGEVASLFRERNDLPHFKITSSYFKKKDVLLKYFDRKYMDRNEGVIVIGPKKNIDPYIWRKIMFQYALIQFLRPLKEDKVIKFECEIGDLVLGTGSPEPVEKMRRDIRKIYRRSMRLELDPPDPFPNREFLA